MLACQLAPSLSINPAPAAPFPAGCQTWRGVTLHTFDWEKWETFAISPHPLPALSPRAFLPLTQPLILVLAAFVPAPPVAPVPAPAPMPPVHPPPPMEDEPASKKLKTEDSLVPEEEFLRRNKVSDTRVPAMVIMPSWGGPVPLWFHTPCPTMFRSHSSGFRGPSQILEAWKGF